MDGSARQPPPDGGNAPAFAVTGLAAFGPNAPDLGTLRKMLRDGARAIGPHPRYHKSPLYDPRPGVADRCSSFDGAWIGKGAPRPEGRDAGRFDEQTLWALHLAREALAEAASQGRAPGRDARIGLICGAFDWGVSAGNGGLFLRDYLGEVAHPALAGWQGEDIAAKDPRQASRLAQTIGAKLGLTGPCRTMEAACATGLYALALAQLYLRGGKADAMLVVSASSVEAFFASMGFSALQAVPSGGALSLPLDARSGGLALGQGGVGCLIMPASRADAGCHAILRAIGLASDGRGQHLVSPNPKGQKAA
ncbi:MAG: beta-ketoacyl synthase N-terminal-like domain-containing protein, partial [Pseudomonadota bacterium]